jgi:capsid protein
VRYTKTDIDKLRGYLAELKAEAAGSATRGAIGVQFYDDRICDGRRRAPPPAQLAGSLVREAPFADAAFAAASATSQELGNYWPALHSADSAMLPDRAITVARTHDLVRNDPTASAAVNRLLDMLVGAAVRMASRPDPDALGFDRKDKAQRQVVRDLARGLDREFRLFLKDPQRRCDAQRKLSGQGLFRLGGRTFSTLNETCAAMMWRPEAGARYATCVLMTDPERLSNPNRQAGLRQFRGGIEFSDIGEPLAYHVRQAHPADWYPGAKDHGVGAHSAHHAVGPAAVHSWL